MTSLLVHFLGENWISSRWIFIEMEMRNLLFEE